MRCFSNASHTCRNISWLRPRYRMASISHQIFRVVRPIFSVLGPDESTGCRSRSLSPLRLEEGSFLQPGNPEVTRRHSFQFLAVMDFCCLGVVMGYGEREQIGRPPRPESAESEENLAQH